jgi:hypothetical protein
MKRLVLGLLVAIAAALVLCVGGLWLYHPYVLRAFLHGRGGYWIEVGRDDPGLSPSIQWALRNAPSASPGKLEWRMVREGLEAGELAVMADRRAVKAGRCDCRCFRSTVRRIRFIVAR